MGPPRELPNHMGEGLVEKLEQKLINLKVVVGSDRELTCSVFDSCETST